MRVNDAPGPIKVVERAMANRWHTSRGSRLFSAQTPRRRGRPESATSWHRIRREAILSGRGGRALAGETTDPDGEWVVLLDAVWAEKIARDHPEIGAHPSVRRSAGRVHAGSRCYRPHLRGPTRYYARVPARVNGCWSS